MVRSVGRPLGLAPLLPFPFAGRLARSLPRDSASATGPSLTAVLRHHRIGRISLLPIAPRSTDYEIDFKTP